MLLKLYKRVEGVTQYWEAWDDEEEITVHFGELGQTGETLTVSLAEFEPPDSAIEREAQVVRASGFQEIEHEDLFELILQYRIEGMGTPADIDAAYQIEEILNECLGWTGNGHCDGNDIGSGTMNIYCYVVEPTLAVAPILAELEANELAEGVIIAYQDKNENFVVLHPKDYAGVFNY